MDRILVQPSRRRAEARLVTLVVTRLVASLIAGVVATTASVAARAETIVRQVRGVVEVGRGEPPVWQPLVAGARVAPEERIRTGADGRVELAVDAGTLRVHENSLLTLPAADADADRVDLEFGHSLFDVLRREGRRFEVRTPTVVVSVKGTRFGVDTSEELGVVSVQRGVVGVRPFEASESEATEIVETLVREGFLATGGVDLPIELEVAPAGDPWSAWQTSTAGTGGTPGSGQRPSDVDRARESVRRATDADVVKHAVARRPELLDRLQPQGDARSDTGSDDDTRDAPPASPALSDLDGSTQRLLEDPIDTLGDTLIGGDDSLLTTNILDAERAEDALRGLLDTVDVESITQGAIFPNGQTTPTLVDLEGYAVQDIVLLTEALESMVEASVDSPAPWTPTDVTSFLENDLIQQGGMTTEAAGRLVQLLFGH